MPELSAGAGLDAARRALTAAFRGCGIATPALDARLLVMAACGASHAELICDLKRALSDDERARLSAWAARRLAGEPVSRILGNRAFWNMDFRLSPETLDPRPDTETLVEAVLAALPHRDTRLRILGNRAFWNMDFRLSPETLDPRPDTETLVEAVLAALPHRDACLRILDLGTGTGCILIALLSELPNAMGIGTDVSHAALVTARENASEAGVAERARFVQADWLSGIAGQFDVIVSNPPYIARAELSSLSREVRAHDPIAALDGGPDGLSAYRAILGELGRVMAPGAIAAFEVGAGQAAAVGAIMTATGLAPVQPDQAAIKRDLAGIERALVMKRREAGELAKKELESRVIRASLQETSRAFSSACGPCGPRFRAQP